MQDTQVSHPLPPDHWNRYEAKCRSEGLLPEGFDVRSEPSVADPRDIVVYLGSREYRYPYLANDYSWVEDFFDDINEVGDSGEDVAILDHETQDDVSRHVGLHSAKERP